MIHAGTVYLLTHRIAWMVQDGGPPQTGETSHPSRCIPMTPNPQPGINLFNQLPCLAPTQSVIPHCDPYELRASLLLFTHKPYYSYAHTVLTQLLEASFARVLLTSVACAPRLPPLIRYALISTTHCP